jgi:hypothetical protein
VQSETGLNDRHGKLVTCRVDELHPHPSYVRHHLTLPASQLSGLIARGDFAFREPLVITRERIIIDGYARLELARLRGLLVLPCIEYELTEGEALHWLLQRHLRSNGLNAFSRILLALELEPWFKERSRSNQRIGGQNKGSSKLTEAERLDVRAKIAAAAGVSVGNVSKVKQLTMTAKSELLQALRTGETSIHRAWQWSKLSAEKQREGLRQYRLTKLIRHTNRDLISRHRTEPPSLVTDLGSLIRRLSGLEDNNANPVCVVVLKGRDLGRTVVVSEQLLSGNSDVEGKDNYALPAAP